MASIDLQNRRRQAAWATRRFGLGARPGEIEHVGSDPVGWLQAQAVPEETLPAPLDDLPSTGEDLWAFFGWLFSAGRAARRAKRRGEPPPDGALAFDQAFAERYQTALAARFEVAATTETPFREHLVHFWANHFVISSARPVTVAMPPSFERDVVRPHVMGRFEDMLLASTRHPGMLLYLDNERNLGPSSKRAADPRKRRLLPIDPPTGLNENLAREILELHTLGVDGGYSQADVTRFAKVLSGWRIRVRPFFKRFHDGDDLMRFDDDSHEPGPQTVLGRVYAQSGMDQGEAVLRDLARHPSTARFVATKLVRHFVADVPPPRAVERLAAVFRETDGQLAEVSKALVALPEAWTATAKLRRPEELLMAGARALPEARADAPTLHRVLDEMGQKPQWPPSPAGYADRESEWGGGDAVWKRLAWAQDTSARAGLASSGDALARAEDVLGPLLSKPTRRILEQTEDPKAALALALASPEFQRR